MGIELGPGYKGYKLIGDGYFSWPIFERDMLMSYDFVSVYNSDVAWMVLSTGEDCGFVSTSLHH